MEYSKHISNPAVHPALSGRWTLRDKAAQRRSPLRVCRAWHESSRVKVPVPGL
jgi:hypothetical protein